MLLWVIYWLMVSALLGGAAHLGEAALRAAGRPVRWVWLAAIAGSVMVPLGAWLGWPWRGSGMVELPGAAPFVLDARQLSGATTSGRGWAWTREVVVGVWVVASVGLALTLALSAVRLRRARTAWREAAVEGRRVLISSDVGPAAFGVLRGVIVLPEWAIALEARLRRLMILHEEEHLRAGDPRLLNMGLAVLIVWAWNPVVWWQFRRLRQAMELDCDARVLRREPDVRGYGALLLEVGRRRSAVRWGVAGLVESTSFLERRIRMMGSEQTGRRYGRMALAGALALALGIAACETPEPTMDGVGTDSESGVPALVAADPDDFVGFTPEMTAPSLTNSDEIAEAMQQNYPESLREAGIGGTVGVTFWIDETGGLAQVELTEASEHAALDEAALQVAEVMEFTPAEQEGEPRAVVVSIPIRFQAPS